MNAIKLGWIVCVITAAVAVVTLQQIPEGMELPLHWDIDGQADRIGPAWQGLFMPPMALAIILIIFSALKYLEPRTENLRNSSRAIGGIVLAVVVLMVTLEVVYVSLALGHDVPVIRFVFFSVGLMFTIIGNFLSKMRSTFFVGIRTPWTLSSDDVWRKTHRLGGRMFMILGAIIALGAWFIQDRALTQLTAAGTVITAIFVVAYSWWLWRKEQAS